MKSNPTSTGRLLFSLLMLAAVVLSACGGAATTPAPTNTPEPPTATPEPVVTDYSGEPFVGATWYWLGTQFNDDTRTEVANPAAYTLTFAADGNYSGQADCNFFAGVYSLVDGVLQLQPGPMTLAACPEGSLSDGYIQSLGQVGTFLLQDGKLYLDLALDTGTMEFGPQPTPAVAAQPYANHPLTGKAWQWLRFEASDGSILEPATPQRYVLQFLADGGLRGQADCNSLGGTFVQQEFNLAIEAAELSKVACAEGSLAGQFIQTVTQSTTYTLEGNLMLMTTSGGLATLSALPLIELQPPAEGRPAAQAAGYLSLRSGPGIEFPVLGVIPAGAIAEALGKNADGAWLGINAPVVLGQGWVLAEEMVTSGAENLPVSATPPLPPTATLAGPEEGDPQLA
ncbi:MAG: META domain-containing protein, partial [Anaerolineales bacterium]|nr:META domain-containing protein [Anaerolineales bacterium]